MPKTPYDDFNAQKDDLRKELEDKIHKIDSKVDRKTSEVTFWAVIGIVGCVIGCLFLRMMDFESRLAKTEQKMDDKQMNPPSHRAN